MKKPLIYIVSGILIVGAVTGGYFATVGSDKNNAATTTASETVSATETTTVSTTAQTQTTASTTQTTATTTKAASTTSAGDKYAFVRQGVYYIYDDSKTACYALAFKKDGKVNVSQFDESNIVYEDPQYFKGFTEYRMDGNKVVIDKMPENVLVDSITLTAKDGALYYGKTKLENHGDVKLKYAAEHFKK